MKISVSMKNVIALYVVAGEGLKISKECSNRIKIKEKRNMHTLKLYNIYPV